MLVRKGGQINNLQLITGVKIAEMSHLQNCSVMCTKNGSYCVMDVLVTCKNEKDLIKNEGARVDTTLYSNFSDAQGQSTLLLVSVSGRKLNSSKLSCMSSLPARMRMIDSKMKELEWSQDFSHYKSMGIFQIAQGQLTPQSLVRSGRISNSSEIL